MPETLFLLMNAVARRKAAVERKGCALEVSHDYERVARALRSIGKPYLTQTLSAEWNDFTWGDCFWMTVSRDGDLLGALGVKIERIGIEPVSAYWRRSFRRQYGGSRREVIGEISPLVDKRLGGTLAYFGDLYLSPELRKLNIISDLGHAALFYAAHTLRADYNYAFLKPRDLVRGFDDRLGLMHKIRRAQVWLDPVPESRGSYEVCCYSSMEDVIHLAEVDMDSAKIATA